MFKVAQFRGATNIWKPGVTQADGTVRHSLASSQHELRQVGSSHNVAPKGYPGASGPTSPGVTQVKSQQYNTPIGLYSDSNVQEALHQQTQGFNNLSVDTRRQPGTVNPDSETYKLIQAESSQPPLPPGTVPHTNIMSVEEDEVRRRGKMAASDAAAAAAARATSTNMHAQSPRFKLVQRAVADDQQQYPSTSPPSYTHACNGSNDEVDENVLNRKSVFTNKSNKHENDNNNDSVTTINFNTNNTPGGQHDNNSHQEDKEGMLKTPFGTPYRPSPGYSSQRPPQMSPGGGGYRTQQSTTHNSPWRVVSGAPNPHQPESTAPGWMSGSSQVNQQGPPPAANWQPSAPSPGSVRTVWPPQTGGAGSTTATGAQSWSSQTQQTWNTSDYNQSQSARRGHGVLNPASGIGTRVPVCDVCRNSIRGPFVTAIGKCWCPEHFVCANPGCRVPLQDKGFVEEKGQLYCERDYEKYYAPRCAKCSTPIIGDILNAMNQQFHPDCFKCTHCRKPFGNSSFYLEDGQPYCEKDWNSLFTTKCNACNYAIEAGDRWVEALEKNYHSQCFKCTKCQRNLEGQSFFAKQGKPYCREHAR